MFIFLYQITNHSIDTQCICVNDKNSDIMSIVIPNMLDHVTLMMSLNQSIPKKASKQVKFQHIHY